MSMKLLQIDELLYNVLFKEDLLQFAPVLAKNTLTRAEHFSQVTDNELQVSINMFIYIPPPSTTFCCFDFRQC